MLGTGLRGAIVHHWAMRGLPLYAQHACEHSLGGKVMAMDGIEARGGQQREKIHGSTTSSPFFRIQDVPSKPSLLLSPGFPLLNAVGVYEFTFCWLMGSTNWCSLVLEGGGLVCARAVFCFLVGIQRLYIFSPVSSTQHGQGLPRRSFILLRWNSDRAIHSLSSILPMLIMT